MARDQTFADVSSNEWLLRNAPYTHGDVTFLVVSASARDASVLSCPEGSALFVIDRLTWNGAQAVTKVRLIYAPGHQMRTQL